MPRLSLAVILLALFLLVCSWPRAKTDEAVPPQSPAVRLPVVLRHNAIDGTETHAKTVLMAPGSHTFPPGNWMHADLVGFLELKGLRVEVKSGEPFNQPERPAIILRSGSDTDDALASVIVYRCKDARNARATSATMGPNAFSRGLFAFGPLAATTRTANLLRDISLALLQRQSD